MTELSKNKTVWVCRGEGKGGLSDPARENYGDTCTSPDCKL